jgi:hypothetical protein
MAQEYSSENHPQIKTYDSGYEHSVEHWLELQKKVAAAAEKDSAEKPKTMTAAAGF